MNTRRALIGGVAAAMALLAQGQQTFRFDTFGVAKQMGSESNCCETFQTNGVRVELI